ncbi:MAG: cellulase family glycosylhydrolase [Thermogutta sp.]
MRRGAVVVTYWFFLALLPFVDLPAGESHTVLGVDGARFTINGKPTFLLGVSYYGGIGAPEETWKRDLEEINRRGFNWVRIWANWQGFDQKAFAVDAEGNPYPPGMEKLQAIVAFCDERGMVVDVSLSRGNGVTGPRRLQSLEAHRRAVRALVQGLKDYKNWYLDLSNERNIQDSRFTPIDDLIVLRKEVRAADPQRLVTASHAGDIADDVLQDYISRVGVDFITPHRPRNKQSPEATEQKTREYLAKMENIGKVVPVHYQEPFRRGFGSWNPPADAFLSDLKGAYQGGAAGWCFHNGDSRAAADGRPRRSFDLREGSLFDQLDSEEQKALTLIQGFWETVSGQQ